MMASDSQWCCNNVVFDSWYDWPMVNAATKASSGLLLYLLSQGDNAHQPGWHRQCPPNLDGSLPHTVHSWFIGYWRVICRCTVPSSRWLSALSPAICITHPIISPSFGSTSPLRMHFYKLLVADGGQGTGGFFTPKNSSPTPPVSQLAWMPLPSLLEFIKARVISIHFDRNLGSKPWCWISLTC